MTTPTTTRAQGDTMAWHPDIPLHYRDQIVTGDARALARDIPDASVDICFTDPPYPRDFLPLYGWLAQEAARILKPGAYLFAYCGAETLPDVFDQMRVDGLSYFWTDVLLHNGGYPRIWYKRLMSGYKPVAVFTKGKPSITPWRSTVDTASTDKRYHEWGQGGEPAIRIIDMLTGPGAVVWEPFCGGGTIPAVCKMLNRHYIASEIDPATAERARERVLNTQPPLEGLIVEQASLLEVAS